MTDGSGRVYTNRKENKKMIDPQNMHYVIASNNKNLKTIEVSTSR